MTKAPIDLLDLFEEQPRTATNSTQTTTSYTLQLPTEKGRVRHYEGKEEKEFLISLINSKTL